MKNKTIEERAKEYDSQIGRCYNDEGAVDIETLYIEIATEQDKIARAEERERCIRIAQDVHCGMCSIYEICHNLDGGNFGGECHAKENIRKAMEKGGNK